MVNAAFEILPPASFAGGGLSRFLRSVSGLAASLHVGPGAFGGVWTGVAGVRRASEALQRLCRGIFRRVKRCKGGVR